MTTTTALTTISKKLSERFGIGDNTDEVVSILKATAFKGGTEISDSQMTALMIVADQYGLNPFTRELYAFPDKGGIVPVVGLDGWARIINEHPQFDGMEFKQDADSCTCIMYRKDRGHAITVTEWLAECYRPPMNGRNGPWQSHPKRMLRHKTLIQCARLTFGFVGIYDQDEAERIIEVHQEREINPVQAKQDPEVEVIAALPACTAENFEKNEVAWNKLVTTGKKTADSLISTLSTKCTFTPAQEAEIRGWEPLEGELS